MAIVDQVTVMTASRDKTVRVWDAFSPNRPFRTYQHQNGYPVTAVAIGDQSGCFASGTEDGSIGLWIFSSVHSKKEMQHGDGDSSTIGNDDDGEESGDADGGRDEEEGVRAGNLSHRLLCGLNPSFAETTTEDYFEDEIDIAMTYTSMQSSGSSKS